MPNFARALAFAALLAAHAVQAADPSAASGPDGEALTCPDPDVAPPAQDGAQLVATHCAMCHKPADLARRLQGAADAEAAKAAMTAFLARHGRCDAAADAAIVDYLANSSFR